MSHIDVVDVASLDDLRGLTRAVKRAANDYLCPDCGTRWRVEYDG